MKLIGQIFGLSCLMVLTLTLLRITAPDEPPPFPMSDSDYEHLAESQVGLEQQL